MMVAFYNRPVDGMSSGIIFSGIEAIGGCASPGKIPGSSGVKTGGITQYPEQIEQAIDVLSKICDICCNNAPPEDAAGAGK